MPLKALHHKDEVKEKWCPFSGHRPDDSSGEKCIGPDCMAWRFSRTHINDGNGGTVLNGETYGFCGLAGHPNPES